MANVTLNAVMAAGNNGDTHAGDNVASLTTAGGEITVAAGSNRAAYVTIGWDVPATAVACTWNGTAMTLVGQADTAPGSPHGNSAIFALANDAQVAADTTPVIALTWTGGSADVYLSAIVLNNVQQSANGINAANTVTDNTGDLTIDVTGTSDGATICTHIRNGGEPTTVGTGMTKFWGFDSFNPGGAGGYKLNLTGTNAYDFNSGSLGTVRASVGINVLSDGVAGDTLMAQGILLMADIFRGLLVIEIKRHRARQAEADKNFLLLTTPTVYTAGSSLEWPIPAFVDREQPDYFSAYPLLYSAAPPPPPIPSTLMGQACL